jgi:hypothetical protein
MLYSELERAHNFDPCHPTERMMDELAAISSAFEARARNYLFYALATA